MLLNTEVDLIEVEGVLEVVGENLFYSEIDKTAAEGMGAVTLRKELLLSDTLDVGKLSACRHANGRDWWVILPAFNSNLYYRYLLTPSGIDLVGVQEVGEAVPTGLGQALF